MRVPASIWALIVVLGLGPLIVWILDVVNILEVQVHWSIEAYAHLGPVALLVIVAIDHHRKKRSRASGDDSRT